MAGVPALVSRARICDVQSQSAVQEPAFGRYFGASRVRVCASGTCGRADHGCHPPLSRRAAENPVQTLQLVASRCNWLPRGALRRSLALSGDTRFRAWPRRWNVQESRDGRKSDPTVSWRSAGSADLENDWQRQNRTEQLLVEQMAVASGSSRVWKPASAASSLRTRLAWGLFFSWRCCSWEAEGVFRLMERLPLVSDFIIGVGNGEECPSNSGCY